MRDNMGMSLIELIVVVSVIGILALGLGLNYQGWLGNYRIEIETKTLYIDLMEARTKALTRNRMYFVELNANNYSLYEDSDDDTAFNPGAGDNPEPEYRVSGTLNVKPKRVEHTLGWTGDIGFDTRGFAWDYTANPPVAAATTVQLTFAAGMTPDYDCIVLDQIRIRMGRMSGGVCAAK